MNYRSSILKAPLVKLLNFRDSCRVVATTACSQAVFPLLSSSKSLEELPAGCEWSRLSRRLRRP